MMRVSQMEMEALRWKFPSRLLKKAPKRFPVSQVLHKRKIHMAFSTTCESEIQNADFFSSLLGAQRP
jgi:hypothetical protein